MMWIALMKRSKSRKTRQIMKMNLRTMLNLFREEKQRDTNKMTLNQFHQLKNLAVMKFLSRKVRRETTHKKGRESLEITLGKHKSLTSKKNLLMIKIKDKVLIRILPCEIKKELILVSSPPSQREFLLWWTWKSISRELVHKLTLQTLFKPKTSTSQPEVQKLITEIGLIRINKRRLEDLIIQAFQ